MSSKISILGSINLDSTYHVDKIPLPGETIHVNKKTFAAGGKGANQAVAAKRSGATVSFIGAVGNDAAGKYMLNELEKEKINLSNVQIKDTAQTGTATVLLDENGQNSILVYAGANGLIDSSQINKAEDTIANSDYIIAQFETPISAIISAFTIAKKHGVTTILNPAPATTIDNKLLKVTNIIVPNETESAAITGINVTDEESMQRTARYFREKGVKVNIITLGSRGVYYSSPTENRFISAYKVNAVDTTGAGDTFIGAMTSVLTTDLLNISAAIDYGQQASSITVQGIGAQPSIPTKEKIKQVYRMSD